VTAHPGDPAGQAGPAGGWSAATPDPVGPAVSDAQPVPVHPTGVHPSGAHPTGPHPSSGESGGAGPSAASGPVPSTPWSPAAFAPRPSGSRTDGPYAPAPYAAGPYSTGPHPPDAYGAYPRPAAYPGALPPRGTNTMAILAIVFTFVFPVLGIVFAAIGRRQIARTGEEGRTMATVALVVSIVFTALQVLAVIAYVVSAAIALNHLHVHPTNLPSSGFGPFSIPSAQGA